MVSDAVAPWAEPALITADQLLAFIRSGREPAPGSPERRTFPRLCPDLVVEIVSPWQHRPEMADKARLWLASGAQPVWVIWPSSRQVDVRHSGETEPAQAFHEDHVLTGEPVLPGFSPVIADLWK